jgi:hypothetical protein
MVLSIDGRGRVMEEKILGTGLHKLAQSRAA